MSTLILDEALPPHLVNVVCECPHTLYFYRSNMNETLNQLRLMTNNEIQIEYCFKKKESKKISRTQWPKQSTFLKKVCTYADWNMGN